MEWRQQQEDERFRRNDHEKLVADQVCPLSHVLGQIVLRGGFTLRGVRSPAARTHLSAMRLGDEVLYYHSQQELAVVGVMSVSREAYPDPTSADPQWLTCDFTPLQTLPRPVTLAALKADSRLATLALLNQPRLAVMSVAPEHFQIIAEEMGQ